MLLADLVDQEPGKLTAFAKRVGVSKSYLCHVLKGRKPLGPSLAVKVFNATGHKIGPLAESPTEQAA